MATIKEISEKANVSIATVSKVLNGKGRVTDQTRQHILDIANELNYRPNLYARNLKAKSTKTIGIITEDLTVFNAPEIVDGIAATCEENGYHYILGNLRLFKLYGNGPKDPVRTKAITQEVVDHMISNQVDGIIYIGYIAGFEGDFSVKFVIALSDILLYFFPVIQLFKAQKAKFCICQCTV